MLRLVSLLMAGALVCWSVIDSSFRDAEGFLGGRTAFVAAVAVATAVLGFMHSWRLTKAGGWIALALIGSAASLQLIDAGPHVRIQHYSPLSELVSADHLPFVAIVIAQSIVCLIAAARHLTFPGSRGRSVSRRRFLFLAVVFVLASATFSRSPLVYGFELVLATLVQLNAIACVLMAAMSMPASSLESAWRQSDTLLGDDGLIRGAGQHRDRFAIVASLVVATVAGLLSLFVYENHPHIPDEVGYIINAKYFAAGMLFMPPPPVPEAFDVDLMQMTMSSWYSPMPPGWPAFLSVFVKLRAPWLANPFLAGLNVILAYRFLLAIYPRRTARLAVLLLCMSPWYVFMGMNLMTHMLSLAAALIAAVATANWARAGSVRWMWVAGGALGVLSFTRPLEALMVAMLLGTWTLAARGVRRGFLAGGCMAIGSMIVAALTLPYNRALTGSMTRFPLTAYADAHYPPGSNDLGFGSNRGWGWTGLDPFPGHDLVDAVINFGFNLFAVNVELFGWAAGSLLFVLLLFRKKAEAADYGMLAVVICVAGISSLYWFSGGPDFGARYWFLMVVPLAALTARGIVSVGRNGGGNDAEFNLWGARSLIVGAVLCGISVATFFPWRAIDKYHHYRGMRPDIRQLAARHSFGRSLVLIEGERHPDFASAVIYNSPRLGAGNSPVFAWARTAEVAGKARAAFPDRPVWSVRGPSLTGRGFVVVAPPANDTTAETSR